MSAVSEWNVCSLCQCEPCVCGQPPASPPPAEDDLVRRLRELASDRIDPTMHMYGQVTIACAADRIAELQANFTRLRKDANESNRLLGERCEQLESERDAAIARADAAEKYLALSLETQKIAVANAERIERALDDIERYIRMNLDAEKNAVERGCFESDLAIVTNCRNRALAQSKEGEK